MYKGETQCYDSIESVGIGSPALMSQTKMIRNSNSKQIIIYMRDDFRIVLLTIWKDRWTTRKDWMTLGKDEISNQ